MFTALLDTSVLWPNLQRDFLLSLAVAAAIVGGAEAIVTLNDKDFPAHLVPRDIQVMDPAAFAFAMVAADPAKGMRAVQEIVARSGRKGPQLTVEAVLQTLTGRYNMTETSELISSFLDP